MIETYFRKIYQKIYIDPLLNLKFLQKLHPNTLTYIACLSGVSIVPLLSFKLSFSAFVMLGFSGFLDTLDGSLARHLDKTSPKGTALDIVSDRIVEFAIIFW